jgi:hypothetical protein
LVRRDVTPVKNEKPDGSGGSELMVGERVGAAQGAGTIRIGDGRSFNLDPLS